MRLITLFAIDSSERKARPSSSSFFLYQESFLNLQNFSHRGHRVTDTPSLTFGALLLSSIFFSLACARLSCFSNCADILSRHIRNILHRMVIEIAEHNHLAFAIGQFHHCGQKQLFFFIKQMVIRHSWPDEYPRMSSDSFRLVLRMSKERVFAIFKSHGAKRFCIAEHAQFLDRQI